MNDISGKVAVVTGGATGIGRSVALALADRGARAVVIVYSRSSQEADDVVVELKDRGTEGLAVRADVSVESDVLEMVDQTVRTFGGIDVLVNSAGTTDFIPFIDLAALTDEVWQRQFEVNVMGPFYCSRAAAPALRASGGGSIINIVSVTAHFATGSSLSYGVMKAGLAQLTRSLAIALAPDVRVNGISPGYVATRWAYQKGEEAALLEHEQAIRDSPLNTATQPEDIADAVLGVLGARTLNGQVIIVDGGQAVTYG